MKTSKTVASIISSQLVMAPLAIADNSAEKQKNDDSPRHSVDEKVETAENESRITLGGKVISAAPDSFMLKYDGGKIMIEMDDYDWYREGYQILKGDEVTVYGVIDADPLETRTVEAGSVWVKGLNTYFYANSDDEEDFVNYMTYTTGFPKMGLTGTISSIDGNEFMLTTLTGKKMQVDVDPLPYDPMDDEGFQRLDTGDRVWVTGTFDRGYFERNEIQANQVITLEKNVF